MSEKQMQNDLLAIQDQTIAAQQVCINSQKELIEILKIKVFQLKFKLKSCDDEALLNFEHNTELIPTEITKNKSGIAAFQLFDELLFKKYG